jgi:Cyclopropane fatty acid synthase and related methyltransferases
VAAPLPARLAGDRALGFDDAFRRLWEYYLCYCEAGFVSGRVDVGLYSLRHAAASTNA